MLDAGWPLQPQIRGQEASQYRFVERTGARGQSPPANSKSNDGRSRQTLRSESMPDELQNDSLLLTAVFKVQCRSRTRVAVCVTDREDLL
jgi:hypothetical protein